MKCCVKGDIAFQMAKLFVFLSFYILHCLKFQPVYGVEEVCEEPSCKLTAETLCHALKCNQYASVNGWDPADGDEDEPPVTTLPDQQQTNNQTLKRKTSLPLTKIGNKEYYFYTGNTMNWYQSFQFCASQGMRLLTLQNAEENNAVKSHVLTLVRSLSPPRMWTAGTDQAVEGEFIWMTTGQRIDFSGWQAGEPNNLRNEEHCLEYYSQAAFWNDESCKTRGYCICEYYDKY